MTNKNGISWVYDILENAERIGAEWDEPEGSRYIQLSDTLVNEMLEQLNPLVSFIRADFKVDTSENLEEFLKQ